MKGARVPINLNIDRCFATPICALELERAEAMNPALLESCYALRDSDPAGVRNTNQGGWQSQADLLERAEFADLSTALLEASLQVGQALNIQEGSKYFLRAWVNISPPGAFNEVHSHPNCHLSGVYYLKTPPDSGVLVFRDPRAQLAAANPPVLGPSPLRASNIRVPVAPGRLFLFPSWLEHSVERNGSQEDRVSVAFNVQVRSGG